MKYIETALHSMMRQSRMLAFGGLVFSMLSLLVLSCSTLLSGDDFGMNGSNMPSSDGQEDRSGEKDGVSRLRIQADQQTIHTLVGDFLIGNKPLSRDELIRLNWEEREGRSLIAAMSATPALIKARDVAGRLLKVDPSSLTDAQREERLQKFLSDLAADSDVEGIDDVKAAITHRITRLHNQSRISELMADAQRAFDSSLYEECLTAVDSLAMFELDSGQKQRRSTLRNRARFHQTYGHIRKPTDLSDLSALRSWKEQLNQLFRDFKQPPAAMEKDLRAYQSAQADLWEAEVQVAVKEELLAKQSQRSSSDEAIGFVDRAKAVLAIVDSTELRKIPNLRRSLRVAANEWFETSFPQLSEVGFGKYEEAQRAVGGQWDRGSWKRIGSGASKLLRFTSIEGEMEEVTPRVYKDLDANEENGRQWKRQVESERLIKKYNAQLGRLRKNLASKDAWKQFAAVCAQNQAYLQQYKAAGGLGREQENLSFSRQDNSAREIVNDWNVVGQFFRLLQ